MRLREHPGIGEGRTDILPCDPRQLSILENYNVRDLTTPEARAELDELKAQVKEHGVRSPLVVKFDGERIFIVEGHRRHKVALELIEEYTASNGLEGRFIDYVPIKAEAPGTNEIDRDFGLETSNSGSRLKPLELANLIYRLHTQRGLPLEAIAQGLGKSLPVIKNTLALRAMPEEVKEHVRAGDISATLAGKISKNVDPKVAAQRIKENLEENKRITGTRRRQTKVTPRSLKRNETKAAESPKQEPKPEASALPAPATFSPLSDETPPTAAHEPHPQLQAAVEKESGADRVVTLPSPAPHPTVAYPNKQSLVFTEVKKLLGRLATIAEDSALGERDPSESIPVPIDVIAEADRLYRTIIGDTTADEAA
jgi:ParB-like chromosome segregation protein Spo0J